MRTDATFPSGSEPEPANEIDPPGLMVMFDDGLVMVAVGAWFAATMSVTVVLLVIGPLVPRMVSV